VTSTCCGALPTARSRILPAAAIRAAAGASGSCMIATIVLSASSACCSAFSAKDHFRPGVRTRAALNVVSPTPGGRPAPSRAPPLPGGAPAPTRAPPLRMAHPLHIHGALFRVLSIEGEAPPAHLAGCARNPLAVRAAENSDRHPVTVEFMIFVISALTSAKICKIMNELDRGDPFHHLKPELIFAAQP
jgi:hypothetical protein